jgi:hypothetical protein
MRMWMVAPRILCRKHLLGEHVEIHMLVGTMKKGHSLKGYIANNLIEPWAIIQRHNDLANEMINRGYRHLSPISSMQVNTLLMSYPYELKDVRVDVRASTFELFRRCNECNNQHWQLIQDDAYRRRRVLLAMDQRIFL